MTNLIVYNEHTNSIFDRCKQFILTSPVIDQLTINEGEFDTNTEFTNWFCVYNPVPSTGAFGHEYEEPEELPPEVRELLKGIELNYLSVSDYIVEFSESNPDIALALTDSLCQVISFKEL